MEVDPAAGSPDAPGTPAPDTTPPGGAPEASPELDFSDNDPFAPIEGEPEPSPEWKEHVHKLRQQGGAYRLKAKELKEQVEALAPVAGLFDGWEPEQIEGWRAFLGSAQEDPGTALAAMLTQGFGFESREDALAAIEAIYGEGEPGSVPEPTPSGDPDDPNRPLTRADLDAIEAERAQEAAVQREVDALHAEVKELGYDPDAQAGTPDEARLQRLFYLTHLNGGDTKKAHEALVAEEQEIVKRHLDSLAEQANGLPSVTGNNGGAAAPVGDRPKTFADAEKAASEWLRASAST